MRIKQYTTILFSVCLSGIFLACQSEESIPDNVSSTGRIVLHIPQTEPFVEVGTRAEQQLTDLTKYSFTLKGKDSDGQNVNQEITFTEGCSIIPAGNYTLTAENSKAATTGTGEAYYSGTSATFSLTAGGSADVSINLGRPKNARIDFSLDDTFTSLYEDCTLTYHDDNREFTLSSTGSAPNQTSDNVMGAASNQASVYVMIPSDGRVTFTIQAKAKKGSHVADLPQGGLTCSMQVQPGIAYPLQLSAKSISDLMIGWGEGEHEGKFD